MWLSIRSLSRVVGKQRMGVRQRPRPPQALGLERLEDRTVPSAWTTQGACPPPAGAADQGRALVGGQPDASQPQTTTAPDGHRGDSRPADDNRTASGAE